MNDYEHVHIIRGERSSLFSFHFHRKKKEEDIKHFRALYLKYNFIEANYTGRQDEIGQYIPDGTYSISEDYLRYKSSRRKWLIAHLPNWIALVASFGSLALSIFNFICNYMTCTT